MRSFVHSAGLTTIAICGLLTAAPSRADEDIPAYRILGCQSNCPVFVAAVPISEPKPNYPSRDVDPVLGAYVEAKVDVSYTIATDGTVKRATIEHILGPPEFGDNVLAAVNSYKFQPATENGKPVEQNRRAQFLFYVSNPFVGARASVVSRYHEALALARDDKLDDAVAGFRAILAEPRLNFYERTMVAFALAETYATQKNYPMALEQVRNATILEGKFLDKRSRAAALRLRVDLETSAGEFSEALLWFDVLKKYESISDDDSVAQLVAKLHATLESPVTLQLTATIPSDGTPWHHTLLRRRFDFSGINGKLTGFDLRCQQHGIESALSDKAQWTVPQSWSDCVIYVAGTPGSSFNFNESVPSSAATGAAQKS